MSRTITRGDVYYADLEPVVGSEQGGVRPVLVIQNNKGNANSPTVIVAAITSKAKPKLPTHLSLTCVPELDPKSVALLEQLRTIDKRRLEHYVGSIGKKAMRFVDAVLARSLDIKPATRTDTMTLCHVCKEQFEESGFEVHLLSHPDDPKDTCDYCNHRTGFDYEIEEV